MLAPFQGLVLGVRVRSVRPDDSLTSACVSLGQPSCPPRAAMDKDIAVEDQTCSYFVSKHSPDSFKEHRPKYYDAGKEEVMRPSCVASHRRAADLSKTVNEKRIDARSFVLSLNSTTSPDNISYRKLASWRRAPSHTQTKSERTHLKGLRSLFLGSSST